MRKHEPEQDQCMMLRNGSVSLVHYARLAVAVLATYALGPCRERENVAQVAFDVHISTHSEGQACPYTET